MVHLLWNEVKSGMIRGAEKEHLKENLKLLRAGLGDAQKLHVMQARAFQELFDKYQDFDTSPANEGIEKIESRLKQESTFYYFICLGQEKVGAVRVIDEKEAGRSKWISPIYILPEFQDKGIAQNAILQCEKIHGEEGWELETILQEEKNCYLYEKLGYRKTGQTQVIHERLTLVFYKKD